jgi:hypothetical protein
VVEVGVAGPQRFAVVAAAAADGAVTTPADAAAAVCAGQPPMGDSTKGRRGPAYLLEGPAGVCVCTLLYSFARCICEIFGVRGGEVQQRCSRETAEGQLQSAAISCTEQQQQQ